MQKSQMDATEVFGLEEDEVKRIASSSPLQSPLMCPGEDQACLVLVNTTLSALIGVVQASM